MRPGASDDCSWAEAIAHRRSRASGSGRSQRRLCDRPPRAGRMAKAIVGAPGAPLSRLGRKQAQDLTGAALAGIREASVRTVATGDVNASVPVSSQ